MHRWKSRGYTFRRRGGTASFPRHRVHGAQLGEGRRTAHEFVRESLRRAILRGDLTGGSRLIQGEVAATLNVSTTPVREALRDLATEGLITLDRHRGGTVRELDWDDMEEIGMVREALDPLAVRLFCERITDEQLREAESLWRQMEKQKGEASTKDSQLHAQLEKYDGAYTACLTRRGYTVK